MSFFEDASLVLIPSAQKTSKVYSAKPTDGTGDLAFTRSNDTATRVGPDGLIEKVRTNTYLYSNTFTDAAWTNLRMNFTAAAGANPLDGANDSFKAIPDTNSGIHAIRQTIVYGVLSIYAKKGENEKIGFRDDGDTGFYATFNLNTGVLIEKSASALASITALSGGWYRVQFAVPTSSSKLAGIYFLDNAYTSGSPVSNVYAGNGTDGLFIYASQAETGDIATPYIATTTAAVSVGPVANVPRLDYLNSSCPRLLLEGQRTNIKTSSENATGWGNPINITTSLNVATSPDGFVNADKIIETATSANHRFDVDFSATSGTAYTFSYFAKAAERTQCHIHGYSDNGVFSISTAIFNLSNGTIVSNTGGGSASIVNYGNGWYRVSLTLTAGATALGYWGFGLALNGATNYLGVATNGALFYGIQLEAGAYATSYIPTLGAAVTRGADACSKTGISSLIGQTEGTLFAEFEVNPLQDSLAIWTRNSATGLYGNMIYLGTNSSNQSRTQIVSGSVVQADIVGSTMTAGFHKFAVAYKNNDFAFYVDGVLVGTSNSGVVPTGMNELYIDQYIDGGIRNASKKQALLFKTRLSNADLAALTA